MTVPERDSRIAALLDEDPLDLYEHAPCGYLSTTQSGVILKVNATFVEWTGYEAAGLLQQHFPQLLTAGGRLFFETHLRPLLAMQGSVKEIALDIVCADARVLPALVNVSDRWTPDQTEAIRRIVVFDATERRRYEREILAARDEAQRAADARTELINMISHDVRAPLGAVVTAAELLRRTGVSPDQDRFLQVIQSSTSQAVALLNSILQSNRMDAGRTALVEQPLDLRAMVEGVVSSTRLAATRKPGLSVIFAYDDRIPSSLNADRRIIEQVLTNLATNAVKFTERGYVSVLVSASEIAADRVLVEFVVSDTGIGIPAERLTHIFDEFAQASDDIGQRYGGTGFGLAIVRKLLKLYDANITVTSVEGQGSTFSFQLSLARA
ncbi:MAG TPA: ATP-binding protein [Vicinamibacterales bacterium]|nr:ATP-binding protein [Vicinamibacterales bacterium]